MLKSIVIILSLSFAPFLTEAGQAKERKKILKSEKTYRSKKGASDKKNIDFDATDIGGRVKTPLGSMIGQSKPDKNFDFIKIRLRWHPEMIQSSSELDAGR